MHTYLGKNNVDLIVVAIDQNTAGDERINEYCPWRNGEFSEKLLDYKSESGGKGAKKEEWTGTALMEERWGLELSDNN
jgi:hypothetical protein